MFLCPLQFRNLPSLWRVNKPDFFIWLITASVSIVGDLDLGLLAGVTSSVFSILVVSQLTPGKLLGKSETEDVILTVDRKGAQPVPGVRIFRYVVSGLYPHYSLLFIFTRV